MTIWRDVVGWEGLYQVSDRGDVRSLDRTVRALDRFRRVTDRVLRGKVLARCTGSHGYLAVSLSHPERGVHKALVHVLVAEAFLGPKPEGMETCHWDGVRANAELANLRYDTPRNNALDRHRHGTFAACVRGEASPKARLTEADVRWIRSQEGRMTHRAIGEMLGVGHRTVGEAMNRNSWRHV